MRSQLRHLAFVVSVLSVLVALPVKAQVNEDSFETEVPQVAQARVQVTGVRLNSTPEGLEVVLITTGERLPQSFQTSIGETLVIDLINTQLPDGVTTLSEVR